MRDWHDVAVAHGGDGNRGPVHCRHVPRPVVGGAEIGPVGIHPVHVRLGNKKEIEKATKGMCGEDDEKERPQNSDGALEPCKTVFVSKLAKKVEHSDCADQL